MIFVVNTHPSLRFPKRETFRTIRSVLQGESASPLALSVVFVGSRYIRKINKQFLDHDYVTDVIAFPFEDELGVNGELYINLDRAKVQAREYNVTFSEETRRLLIHGTLHLLGYSDETARAQARMRKREDFYLEQLSNKGRGYNA